MKWNSALFALIMLGAIACADVTTNADFFGAGYDMRQANIFTGQYNNTTVVFSNVYGVIKYLRIENRAGADFTCSIYNENNTLWTHNTTAAGVTFLNRSTANYTNYGNLNITCNDNSTGGYSLTPANVLHWWKLDAGTGNSTTNSIGADTLELPAVINNTYVTNWMTGKIYNATFLNGSNTSFMRVNDSSTMNITSNKNFTIAFWLYTNSSIPTNVSWYLWHKGAALGGTPTSHVNNTSIIAYNNTTLMVVLATNNSSWNQTYTNAAGLFNTTGWTHYAVAWNTTNLSIFVNGSLVLNYTRAHTNQEFANWTSGAANYFGDGYNYSYSTATNKYAPVGYDSIMYFNESLTPAKVAYVYNLSKPTNILIKIVTVRIGNIY
jgi:hypothetical protein